MTPPSALLGLADLAARAPLAEMAAHLGWACFAAACMVLLWVWTRSESLRRSLLALEDPRTMALLRIALVLVTLQCFWNMEPHWRVLFSDEGVVPIDYARARLGGAALAGWSPSEGFFDGAAVVRFFTGKYSFLFLEGAPGFVAAYMIAFTGVLALFAAGVASRVTGVVAMVMMCSLLNRNKLHTGGMDDVLRVFWLLLILARSGHAWSFDNWLRCRILRRRGALQGADGAADPSEAPIYRMIPAWPRYLMMVQLVVIYVQTGAVKTGAAWRSGDALYYALNQDIYYRFAGLTQEVSAIFATNVFRWMTAITRGWEVSFALLGLGMILKFGLDHRGEPWYRAMDGRRGRRWLGRLALVAAYACIYYINVRGYPYMVSAAEGASAAAIEAEIADGARTIHLVYALLIPAAVALWFALGRRPLVAWGPRPLGRWSLPGLRIDQGWVRRWLLGRRLWLGLGLAFHGFLLLFMNLGAFPTAMLATYAAWFAGDEIAAGFSWLLGKVRKVRGLRRLAPAAADRLVIPAAPATRAASPRLADAVVLLSGALGVGVVAYRGWAAVPPATLRPWVLGWIGGTLAIAGLVALGERRARRAGAPAGDSGGGPALAYGPVGRTLALAFVLWHGGSMAMVAAPSYQVLGSWRWAMYGLYDEWTTVTGTDQSWTMFAPDPTRANYSLTTLVIEPGGARWEVPGPAPGAVRLRYDRLRRMHYFMLSRSQASLRLWAELQCREWYLRGGVWPEAIELVGHASKIPPPERVAREGPIYPSQLAVESRKIDTYPCPAGGLPYFMKERYGLPITAEERAQAAREAERQRLEDARKRRAWDARRG